MCIMNIVFVYKRVYKYIGRYNNAIFLYILCAAAIEFYSILGFEEIQ